ncbi:MAG: hypothetical protein LBC73_00570, partial [Oscillospiraceae bacterium]|nr:hypothetical protein [Oscillospiraceae bacterium]
MKKYSTFLLLIAVCFYIIIAIASTIPTYEWKFRLYNVTDVSITQFSIRKDTNWLSKTLEAGEITDIVFFIEVGALRKEPTTVTYNIIITDSNYNSWYFNDFTSPNGGVLVFFFDENGIAQLEHIYTENDNTDEDMQRGLTIIGGVVATMVNPAVDVGVEFFQNLNAGVTYNDIVSEIGKPTGAMGSGLIRPYYAIDGGLFVVMNFTHDDEGLYEHLISMEVYDRESILFKIELTVDNDKGNMIEYKPAEFSSVESFFSGFDENHIVNFHYVDLTDRSLGRVPGPTTIIIEGYFNIIEEEWDNYVS